MTIRILVEPSDYTYYNVGDIAMLQASTGRLRAMWPGARVAVFTDDPLGLARHCPDARPLGRKARQRWLQTRALRPDRLIPIPGQADSPSSPTEPGLGRNGNIGPALAAIARRIVSRDRPAEKFVKTISQSDLLVVAGMGGVTDWFEEFALELLEVLALAIEEGRPTAMLGQGIGPIEGSALLSRAREVLPHVGLIALRERLYGEPLLLSLGVAAENIVTTGDEAVELAFDSRTEAVGDGLGINVRSGWYSKVDEDIISQLRTALHTTAAALGAPLVSVPISHTPGEADEVTITQLGSGYPNVIDAPRGADTPLAVIRHMQRCRIVVAGSYHAAVFALAQGIPTVGLVRSSYYAGKFEGIADMFGSACAVVTLDEHLHVTLPQAVERLWESASDGRQQALESAARQIRAGRRAYGRIQAMLETGS